MISTWVMASSAAMRIGLRMMLQGENLEVIGDSAFWAEFANSPAPVDILVWVDDLSIQDLVRLNQPDLPSLLLITDQPPSAQRLLRFPWRAWGVLLPEFTPEELKAAVDALNAGLVVGEPTLLKVLLEQAPFQLTELANLAQSLTPREIEILQLLAQGLANKQISLALGISEHTVKFHVSSIFTRLGVTNRTEAVRVGLQRGLIAL